MVDVWPDDVEMFSYEEVDEDPFTVVDELVDLEENPFSLFETDVEELVDPEETETHLEVKMDTLDELVDHEESQMEFQVTVDAEPMDLVDENDRGSEAFVVSEQLAPAQGKKTASVNNSIATVTGQLWRTTGRMQRERSKTTAPPTAPPAPRAARRTAPPPPVAKTIDQLKQDIVQTVETRAPEIKSQTSDDVIASHLAQESAKLVNQPSDHVVVHVPFECRDFRSFLNEDMAAIERANDSVLQRLDPLGRISLACIPRSQQATRAASSSSSSSSSSKPVDDLPLPTLARPPYPVFTAPIEMIYKYVQSLRRFEEEAGVPRRITPMPPAPHACPRKHVERMLVGVYGGAKPCVFSNACVGAVQYKMLTREYISPEEYASGQKKPTTERNPCYLCYLLLIFVQYIYQSNQSPSAMLKIQQPFYHIVDKPGEYKSEALIPPISSKVDDTKLTDLLCKTPSTSVENTYGLTAPLVAFKNNNYTVGSVRVRVDGTWKQVPCLKESESLLFTEHAHAFEPLPQVDPFQYIKTKDLYTPTTIFIMNRLFSPDNTEHVIGAERMRAYGQYIDPANHARCLPYRWCLQTRAHAATRFPWQYIFDTDIRVTVAHMPEIVERGCIDIDAVMRRKRSSDLNLVHDPLPEGSYAFKLREEIYTCRTLYVAYRLRVAVLLTLRRVYPQSKNSNRDITVKTRTEILYKWNLKHYHPLLKRTTFDTNVDDRQIARIAAIEPDNHYFPEDDAFRRVERTIVCKQTPREYLVEWLGARPVLEPFDALRRQLAVYHTRNRSYLPFFKESVDGTYIKDTEGLLTRRGYSVFATVYARVNWASNVHNGLDDELHAVEREYKECDKGYAENTCSFERLQEIDVARRLVRERRYMLRLFVLTHLSMVARARQHADWSDAFFMQRVPHQNANYVLRHYDETEPYDTNVQCEGTLPDIAKYMCCVPFPDQKDAGVKENNTSTNHLFRMIGLLLPRNSGVRTNNKQHIKLCTEHPAYRKLAANVVMVSMTGAYRHADYLPPLDHCLHVRNVMVAPQAEHFVNWQRCFKSLAVLAMREYVVFMVKLCPSYHYYLVHQYPYWVQYARQTYALANVVRLAAVNGHSLSSIQYDVQRVIKPKTQDAYHHNADIVSIVDRLVGEDRVIDWTRCRHELQIDELRTLCRHLYMIDIQRGRASMGRIPLPHALNQAIVAKVYSLPRQSPIDLEWLYDFNFGVTEPPESVNVCRLTIELLEYAFYFILLGPQKANNVTLALSAIPPRDYEIVDAFFFNLFTHYSINVIDLNDPDLARRQYEAVLRRNDMTEKDVALSPWAYSLMVGPCCGTIRSYVTQNDGALLYGGDKVCIDPASGSVVCGVKTEYDTKKKSYRVYTLLERRLTQLWMLPQNVLALHRVLKRIMKLVPQELHNRFYHQPKCGEIELIRVPLIGRVAQLTMPKVSRTSIASPTTNAFTICERCGGIMLFSTKSYGPNGLCCQECCMAHTVEMHTPMCVAKQHRIKINTPIHAFKVIDDRETVGTYRLSTMYVCHRCYTRKTAGYVQHSKYILTASGLTRAKHFHETSMHFTVALASGEPLREFFDAKMSNYMQRARARLDRGLVSAGPCAVDAKFAMPPSTQ